MAIDYEAFSAAERDTFVKNVLRENEMAAAIRAATRGGAQYRTPDQLLDFCFRVAVKKMEGLQSAIREAREAETRDEG